jgi:hypothetical protein
VTSNIDRGLDAHRRRLLGAWTLVRACLSASALLALYYILPTDRHVDAATSIYIGVGLLVVLAISAWQVSAIVRSDYPTLRGIEALAVIVPAFLIIFAGAYHGMAEGQPASFSESLSKTDALYFTITVFSTVGFGDITPRTDAARIVVSGQMLADLAILGAGLRVLLEAVKLGRERRSGAGSPPS